MFIDQFDGEVSNIHNSSSGSFVGIVNFTTFPLDWLMHQIVHRIILLNYLIRLPCTSGFLFVCCCLISAFHTSHFIVYTNEKPNRMKCINSVNHSVAVTVESISPFWFDLISRRMIRKNGNNSYYPHFSCERNNIEIGI